MCRDRKTQRDLFNDVNNMPLVWEYCHISESRIKLVGTLIVVPVNTSTSFKKVWRSKTTKKLYTIYRILLHP